MVLTAAVALSACGATAPAEERSEGASQGVGQEIGGSVAALADCGDWNGGTEEERIATIEDIRGQLTAQSDPEARAVLPDERAYELFEESCANDYAEELRLYKLYARAAPFEALRTEPPASVDQPPPE